MSILRTLYQTIYSNLIGDGAYLCIIKGCIYTLLIFLCALLAGFALAALFTFLRTTKSRILRGFGTGVTFLMKGTPVYLGLYLWYYTFLGQLRRGELLIAILALGIFAGGQLSDVLTRAVKKEESIRSEEVTSRARKEFLTAIVPFVTEQSLFEIKRVSCIVLQLSTFVGLIGINDVAQVLITNGFRSRAPFFAIGCAILFYLVLQLILEGIFAMLGRRLTGEEEE